LLRFKRLDLSSSIRGISIHEREPAPLMASTTTAYCIEANDTFDVGQALMFCVQKQGLKLRFLCPHVACQTPQVGQLHPARVSGVMMDSLWLGVTPKHSAHFRFFPNDAHARDCPIVEYAEIDERLGVQRRGRIVFGNESFLILERFTRNTAHDEASSGQITKAEFELADGQSKKIRRAIYEDSFRKNPVSSGLLVRLVESFEFLKRNNLLSKKIEIENVWTEFSAVFRWVDKATLSLGDAYTMGLANVTRDGAGFKLCFFGTPPGKPKGSKIWLRVDFNQLSSAPDCARLRVSLERILSDLNYYAAVYFFGSPIPSSKSNHFNVYLHDARDLVINLREKRPKTESIPSEAAPPEHP
jgi:hypothetical protein